MEQLPSLKCLFCHELIIQRRGDQQYKAWHVYDMDKKNTEFGRYSVVVQCTDFPVGNYTLKVYLHNSTLNNDFRNLSNAEFTLNIKSLEGTEFWIPRNKAHTKDVPRGWEGGMTRQPVHKYCWGIEVFNTNTDLVASCLSKEFFMSFTCPRSKKWHSGNSENKTRLLSSLHPAYRALGSFASLHEAENKSDVAKKNHKKKKGW